MIVKRETVSSCAEVSDFDWNLILKVNHGFNYMSYSS